MCLLPRAVPCGRCGGHTKHIYVFGVVRVPYLVVLMPLPSMQYTYWYGTCSLSVKGPVPCPALLLLMMSCSQ